MGSRNDDPVPVGEGWSRHNGEMLVHAPSQVYFAQRGEQRGKYLVRGENGTGWTVCPAPHVGSESPIQVRAAAASVIRPLPESSTPATGSRAADGDRKLERAVVIAEMPKTARLALKFPLGFLDTPAAAYALFSGLCGSVAAAHWCASQFHQRLLPEIAKRIHGWWDSEAEMPEELLYRGSHVGSLTTVLRAQLEALDRDLLSGPHCFSGCDVVVAVLIGDNLVVAASGQASATLLFEDAEPIPLLSLEGRHGNFDASFGQLRPGHASGSGALLDSKGHILRSKSAWDALEADSADTSASGNENAVSRILRAPDAFSVLGIPAEGPETVAEARSAYKRLALRVHPDKVRDSNAADAKAAFERLEESSRAVEALLEQNIDSCRELNRVLRNDPLTLRGAAAALKVETDADEAQVEKAMTKLKEVLAKVQHGDGEKEVRRGLTCGQLAAETLRCVRQGGSPGTVGERLLSVGVPPSSLGALGLRQLRDLGGGPEVRTAAWRMGEALRVALCCGGTAQLDLAKLEECAKPFQWQPKASALQWATNALELPGREHDTSASAVCICVRDRIDEDCEAQAFGGDDFMGMNRPAKKQKSMPGPKSVRIRHLLLRCAEPGRQLPDDPMARKRKSASARAGAAASQVLVRTPAEAENELIKWLRDLYSGPQEDAESRRMVEFRKLCQQHSECESANNAGQLCGDLGWVSRGQLEPAFEQAAFELRVGDISDVITTFRGVHLIQRLA